MSAKYLLYAPNIHQGGGKSLLIPLLESLQSSTDVTFILDQRLELPQTLKLTGSVYRVNASIVSRLGIEWALRKLITPQTRLLSMSNLPPFLAHQGEQQVFVQNRYLIDHSPCMKQLPYPVRMRLIAERWWLRSCAKYVSKFIVQTFSMGDLLRQALNVTPSILPFTEQGRDNCKQRDAQVTYKYDFLYVASGEPHKNHTTLINAWIILAEEGCFPSLALTLSADRFPALYNWISCMTREHSLKISLLGERSREDIENLYIESRALIYPSTYESFGLPLIEASRAGLPVLASNLPYVSDVIQPSNIFDPYSASSIAASVKAFSFSPSKVTSRTLTPKEFLRQTLFH